MSAYSHSKNTPFYFTEKRKAYETIVYVKMEYVRSALNTLFLFLGVVYPQTEIIVMGLNQAGKTSYIQKLRDGIPTDFPWNKDKDNFDVVEVNDVLVKVDTTAHESTTDGVFFIVDSTDRPKFPLAKALFDRIPPTIPIALLGNKNELPGAATIDELRKAFHISAENPHVFVCTCSIKEGTGCMEAIHWLVDHF